MKRFLSLALVLILSISVLVACDSGDKSYEDGNYTAETDFDDKGWKGVIDVTVEDGEITSVTYDELDEEDNKKSEDEEYAESMEGAAGITPEDAYEQLEEALINTQDPEQIDAVAGATGSTEQFKKLAEEALN